MNWYESSEFIWENLSMFLRYQYIFVYTDHESNTSCVCKYLYKTAYVIGYFVQFFILFALCRSYIYLSHAQKLLIKFTFSQVFHWDLYTFNFTLWMNLKFNLILILYWK